MIMFGYKKYVPSQVSYKFFISFCVLCFTVCLFLIPGLEDLYMLSNRNFVLEILMKINYMFLSLFSAKLFTPAVNILLNMFLCKYKRNGLNSIFHLGCCLLTLMFNRIAKDSSNYFFDDLIEPMSKLNKYYAMWLFVLC